MSAPQRISSRGAAPVGHLGDLGAVECRAVVYLRLWWEGDEARHVVAEDFALALGEAHGRAALASLEQFCTICTLHGRRPLMRHGLGCTCVGADEACLAHMIGAASEAEREDAIMIATMIVRADMSPCLAAVAEDLGLALRRMSLKVAAPAAVAQRGSAALH